MTVTIARPATRTALIGRDDALGELERFLQPDAEASGAPLVLVASGDAGIGKTCVLDAAADLAMARGYRVLASRPAFGERDLPYAGLADLVAGADDLLGELPEPQRRAFDIALQRAPGAADGDEDWQPVALGLLAILQRMAEAAPTLVIVDDAAWLDRSTARVLAFALRRLATTRVRLIAAVRPDSGPPELFERAGSELPVQRTWLGPMTREQIGRLVRERLDVTLPLPVLARLHALTAGNPFYALQIASGWQAARTSGVAAARFPLPEALTSVLADRLASLSDEALEALLVVGAMSRADIRQIDAVVGDPARLQRGLEEAEASGIVTLDGTAVTFRHPLLAATVYEGASPPQRRELHKRLAQTIDDDVERARHLAAATIWPDPDVVAVIERGAAAATSRAAPDAAAELMEAAARLTSPTDGADRLRRLFAAADHHRAAGDSHRARDVLRAAVDEAPHGPLRAEALNRLAMILTRTSAVDQAVEAWRLAIEDAPPEGALAGDIQDNLAWYVCWLGDTPGAYEHARTALGIAEQVDDPALLVRVLTKVAMLRFQLGEGVQRESLSHVGQVEEGLGQAAMEADDVLIQQLMWADELDEAEERAAALLARARDHGDVAHEVDALYFQMMLNVHRGKFATAEELAVAVRERALHAGADFLVAVMDGWLGQIVAMRGRFDEGRRLLQAALPIAQREQHRWVELRATGALALLEMAAGRPDEAAARARETLRVAAGVDVPEPGIFHAYVDAIEALVLAGAPGEAEPALADLEERARRFGRRYAIAAAARCRGLVLSATGDVNAGTAELDRSVASFEELPYAFDLARSRLAAGIGHRRIGHKGRARQLLEAAAGAFEELDATPWADRARRELGRVSGRAPSRSNALTETERQVAELVAAGRSNREVADALFITIRTVESNLTRAYQKLDVRSRSQLARALANGDAASLD